jgi:hypothetical protein
MTIDPADKTAANFIDPSLSYQQLAYGLAHFLDGNVVWDFLLHWSCENEQAEELCEFWRQAINEGEIQFYSFRNTHK